ncbi:MAG: Sapep family Mn(2+)-dependent dipeptidase [Christensenellales bacterium]|mgnify:CR=1 FL=1|jgi:succinyl-diaminopimelate desuccinylase
MNETKEKALKSLVDLIKIESTLSASKPGAPYGENIRKALDFTLNLLASFGGKTHNLDGYCGWADFGEGEPFGILVHLDVVPASGVWKFPPFSGTIQDGYVYGRGTTDDKGPAIAVIYALKKLIEEGLVPKRKIRVILGCDEESGWSDIKKYNEVEEMPNDGFSPDGDFPVIYSEKGVLHLRVHLKKPESFLTFTGGTAVNMVPDLAQITVAYDDKILQSALKMGLPTTLTGDSMLDSLAHQLDGSCSTEDDHVQITANGTSAHGSRPEDGESAILILLECLHNSGASKDGSRLYKAFGKTDGSGLGLAVDGGDEGDLTVNVGKAKIKDGSLILHIDIRHPASISKEEVIERLKAALPETNEINIINYHDALYVNPNSPLVQALLNAYRKVTGDSSARPKAIGGATYARVLKNGVAFGPTMPGAESLAHQPNERVSIKDFNTMIDIYYEALKTLVF